MRFPDLTLAFRNIFRRPGFAAVAIALLALSNWIYQEIVMGVSPGRYIERSTPWAINNYLKSWSTGFGVKEIVSTLEKEQRPGIIVADSGTHFDPAIVEAFIAIEETFISIREQFQESDALAA